MSPKILFFYPSNQRTVALETLILEIRRRGVEIELLTTCEAGPFHTFLEARGIPTHTHVIGKSSSALYYLRQAFHLARFCRRGGFTCVFANLQHANFIAVIAQYLMRTRVVAFRHHYKFVDADEGIPLEVHPNERRFDRVINRLARRIVVPSMGVHDGMERREAVDMEKVTVLPYVYDFDRYPRPDPEAVERLRTEHPARVRLLVASRMIPFKRHALALNVLHRLVEGGRRDLHLLLLDDGPLREELESHVTELGLEGRVTFLGFRSDVTSVMAACDLLLHPSLTEASSNVVKEMAILERPAVVCRGVGDFDSYIEDARNGLLVSREQAEDEMVERLERLYDAPERIREMGRAARRTVLERFGVSDGVIERYLELARG